MTPYVEPGGSWRPFWLRLADGRTVLVPTRDPAALVDAPLAGVTSAPDRPPTGGSSGSKGTLDP